MAAGEKFGKTFFVQMNHIKDQNHLGGLDRGHGSEVSNGPRGTMEQRPKAEGSGDGGTCTGGNKGVEGWTLAPLTRVMHVSNLSCEYMTGLAIDLHDGADY